MISDRSPPALTTARALGLAAVFLICLAFHPASAQTLGGSCAGSPYSADEISVVKNNIVVCNTSSVWQNLLGAPAADPNDSITLGASSLANLTSGTNNTALGYGTGPTLTSGSGNILMGSGADVPAASTSDFLNIGNAIFATGMTGTVSSPAGKVGIGTTTPSALFSVGSSNQFTVNSSGNVTVGTPGTNGQLVVSNQYSAAVYGELYSDAASVVALSAVNSNLSLVAGYDLFITADGGGWTTPINIGTNSPMTAVGGGQTLSRPPPHGLPRAEPAHLTASICTRRLTRRARLQETTRVWK